MSSSMIWTSIIQTLQVSPEATTVPTQNRRSAIVGGGSGPHFVGFGLHETDQRCEL